MFEPELSPGWKVEVEDGDSVIELDSVGGEVIVPEPPEEVEPEPLVEPEPVEVEPEPLVEPDPLEETPPEEPVVILGNLKCAAGLTKRAERALRRASLARLLAQSLS